MKKIFFLVLVLFTLASFSVSAQITTSTITLKDVPPKVKIILEEYQKVKKETYSCKNGTQDCLNSVGAGDKVSSEDDISFYYPYSSKDNVFETKTYTYTDSFTEIYRRSGCVINTRFNQLAKKGRSVMKCNDQENPIYDVETGMGDPVFVYTSPQFVVGGGKTLIHKISGYDVTQEMAESSKTYLVLEGGRSDTFYRILLTVSASSILPENRFNEAEVGTTARDGWFYRPILCSKIKVNDHAVKGNCTVDLIVRGQSKTYITPVIANVPYYTYGFDILVNGGNPYTRFKMGEKYFDGFEPAVVPLDKVPKSAREQGFTPSVSVAEPYQGNAASSATQPVEIKECLPGHLYNARTGQPCSTAPIIAPIITAAPTIYNLTTTVSGAGSVSGDGVSCGYGVGSSCVKSLNSGTEVTLSASPYSGYTFSGWSGACSGTGSCSIKLDSNKSVSAVFAPQVIIPIQTTTTPIYSSCASTTISGYSVPAKSNGESVGSTKLTAISNGTSSYSRTFTCNSGTFTAGAETSKITCNSGYYSSDRQCVANAVSVTAVPVACSASSVNGYSVPARNSGESASVPKLTSISNGTRNFSVVFSCSNGAFTAGTETEYVDCNTGYYASGSQCLANPVTPAPQTSSGQISLSSIILGGGLIKAYYSNNTGYSAHLVSEATGQIIGSVAFGSQGNNLEGSYPSAGVNIKIGDRVKICHGNNYGICSSVVMVTGSSAKLNTGSLTASAINAGSTSTTENKIVAKKFRFTKFLEQGSYGNEVRELQKFLSNAGYYGGAIDSNFGSKTKEALIKFQSDNKLKADGILGYEVRTFLNR